MQAPTCISPGDLVQALTPSRLHWKDIQSRYDNLEELVAYLASNPIFLHDYTTAYGYSAGNMVMDIRSAVCMLVSRLFTDKELQAFVDRDMMHYVNHGLALSVPTLRKRVGTVSQERLVGVARMACLGLILKLIADDMAEPRSLLEALIGEFDLDTNQRQALLASVITNFCPHDRKFTLH